MRLSHGHFEGAVAFIEAALKESEQNKVFVHCRAGVSRSSTIVIAYLMRCCKMSMDVALEFVRDRRSCIEPNASFMLQLRHFERNGGKLKEQELMREMENLLCRAGPL